MFESQMGVSIVLWDVRRVELVSHEVKPDESIGGDLGMLLCETIRFVDEVVSGRLLVRAERVGVLSPLLAQLTEDVMTGDLNGFDRRDRRFCAGDGVR